MSNVASFLSWKIQVINLMRDQGLPLRLTSIEVQRLESFWYWGYSPEDFVATLNLIKQVGA